MKTQISYFAACWVILLPVFFLTSCSDPDIDKNVYRVARDMSAGEELLWKDLEGEYTAIENTSSIPTYHFVEVMTTPGVITKKNIESYIGRPVEKDIKKEEYLNKTHFSELPRPIF